MALIKNEIPILEYDTEEKAVIMPRHLWNYKFTEKAVMPQWRRYYICTDSIGWCRSSADYGTANCRRG